MHPLDVDNCIKRAFRELFSGSYFLLPSISSIFKFISDNYHLSVYKSHFVDRIYLVENGDIDNEN